METHAEQQAANSGALLDHQYNTKVPKEQLGDLLIERRAPYLIRLAVILPLLAGLHWLIATNEPGWWLLPIYAVIGFILSGLMVLAHEMSHFHLIRHKKLNLAVGTVFALPLAVPYALYGIAHLKHHAFNTTNKDPSHYDRPRFKIVHYLALITHYTYLTFFMSLFSGLEQLFVSNMKGVKPNNYQITLVTLQYSTIVAFLLLAPEAWLWHFLLPLIAFAFWNTVRAIGEHEYLYMGEEGHKYPLETTRSMRMGPLTSFFWWNAGYHIEHHLYPSIPFHNLPQLCSMLKLEPLQKMNYLQYMGYRFKRGVEYPMYF